LRRPPGNPAVAPLLLLALAASVNLPATRASAAANPAFVDAHVHLEPADPERSVQSALRVMSVEHATRIVVMPPPFTDDDPARFDAERILSVAKGYPDRLRVLGGGGTLNAMIQRSARSGDAGPEARSAFRERAEELLRLGAVGFGELTAEHFQGATPYQSAPPDHPLFLLLSDVAAEHGVPIVLHLEAAPQAMPMPGPWMGPPPPPLVPANIEAFERLLSHDPRARIVWAHAGWDNTGQRTPELMRRLLRRHPNLYMDVKVDPLRQGRNSPLTSGARGAIRPEWLELFQEFPDRFTIGSDQHYPPPPEGPQRWEAVVHLLDQLPDDLRRRIAMDNPTRLFGPGPRR